MDGVHHGIDVGWLHDDHHSHKAYEDQQNGSGMMSSSVPVPQKSTTRIRRALSNRSDDGAGNSNTLQKKASNTETSSGRASRSPSFGRKTSWMNAISSKFSSSAGSAVSNTSAPAATSSTDSNGLLKPPTSPKEIPLSPSSPTMPTSPLTSPKADAKSSFLSSALRRLGSSTSSTTAAPTKQPTKGAIVPRRVLNVDPHRQRCQIEALKGVKLQRVSFNVDVEIADDGRRSSYEEEEGDSQEADGNDGDGKSAEEKANDMRMKEKAEGAALKHSHEAAVTKAQTDAKPWTPIIVSDKIFEDTPTPPPETADEKRKKEEIPRSSPPADPAATTRKKEKKKRSEEERKERKERKRQQAIVTGLVPLEINRRRGSATSVTSAELEAVRSQSTNPLRIYRRCCLLRETPFLRRMLDQLALPEIVDPDSPEIVSAIDLSGEKLEKPDVVVLADFFGVVPVRKVILDDCSLTDDLVKIILGALLATKSRSEAQLNRTLSRDNTEPEQLGMIEKLSLKNNKTITLSGWKAIAFFINMAKSLRAIDLHMIPIPAAIIPKTASPAATVTARDFISTIFCPSIQTRPTDSVLEELVISECSLKEKDIKAICETATLSKLSRLGLRKNNITSKSWEYVKEYIESGFCQCLDISGNDITTFLPLLETTFTSDSHPIFALSLADMGLTPTHLEQLLPRLMDCKKLRFLDFSGNPALFNSTPSATPILRRLLPQLKTLKRIHFNNTAMKMDDSIALAEIAAETASLAHVSVLENPELVKISNATDESAQEEAVALFAGFLAAVRISKSLVCVDIEQPGPKASELVKALARQLAVESLRNLHLSGILADSPLSKDLEKASAELPELLQHIVGPTKIDPDHPDIPAPDEDYIVGGTGVVKALSICLGHADASKTGQENGGKPGMVEPAKAKQLSRNLLNTARQIDRRVKSALAKGQQSTGGFEATRRLQYLDYTLTRMIERFEVEFPECRLKDGKAAVTVDSRSVRSDSLNSTEGTTLVNGEAENDDEDEDLATPQVAKEQPLSRKGSDVQLASRALDAEEGRMHLFGQAVRRELLRPQSQDYIWNPDGDMTETEHLQRLRSAVEALKGDDIRDQVAHEGVAGTVNKWREHIDAMGRHETEHQPELQLARERGFKQNQFAASEDE